MSSGPKKPRYIVPRKTGKKRKPTDSTRMAPNPGKPQALPTIEDDFDLDIDITDWGNAPPPPLAEADPEQVPDVSDFFGDEDEATVELSAFQDQQASERGTRAEPVRKPGPKARSEPEEYQLEAPLQSEDLQPLYRPAIGAEGVIAEPVETLSTPDMSDRSAPKGGRLKRGGLFDDLSEEKSMKTVSVAPAPKRPPNPQTTPPPVKLSSKKPKRKGRFSTGLTAGMQPLDLSRFGGGSLPEKNQQKITPRSFDDRPDDLLPMAHARRVRRRRIGLQEVLLLFLILMLGLGVWVGYKIYRSHQFEKEAAAMDVSREQFQKLKDDVIKSNKPKKEMDAP